MSKRITVIQGHPDRTAQHFLHALADAYSEGARTAGHELNHIEVSHLDFPLLRSAHDFFHGPTPEAIAGAQELIRWADHLLILYPLWQGHPPALLHAFFEQLFRPGFAVLPSPEAGHAPKKLLGNMSARIIVTMGMPPFFYRYYLGAHSLKSLQRNILRFSGIKPIKTTLIGRIGFSSGESPVPFQLSDAQRARWVEKVRAHGRTGN